MQDCIIYQVDPTVEPDKPTFSVRGCHIGSSTTSSPPTRSPPAFRTGRVDFLHQEVVFALLYYFTTNHLRPTPARQLQ
jgi:hypothetical protein